MEIKPSDQITDLIFTKLNRLEEMMNQIYKDQAKVRYMIRDEEIRTCFLESIHYRLGLFQYLTIPF